MVERSGSRYPTTSKRAGSSTLTRMLLATGAKGVLFLLHLQLPCVEFGPVGFIGAVCANSTSIRLMFTERGFENRIWLAGCKLRSRERERTNLLPLRCQIASSAPALRGAGAASWKACPVRTWRSASGTSRSAPRGFLLSVRVMATVSIPMMGIGRPTLNERHLWGGGRVTGKGNLGDVATKGW